MFKYIVFGLLAWVSYKMIGQNQATQDMERTTAIIENSKKAQDPLELIMAKEERSTKYTARELECLARNIFFEAGTEDDMGKYAVAQVTVNRVKSGYWGHSICSVVYSLNQFSWTNDQQLATIELDSKNWRESQAIAKNVLGLGIRIKTLKKALFYHADYVSPPWRDDKKIVGKVGHHIFYAKAKGSWVSL